MSNTRDSFQHFLEEQASEDRTPTFSLEEETVSSLMYAQAPSLAIGDSEPVSSIPIGQTSSIPPQPTKTPQAAQTKPEPHPLAPPTRPSSPPIAPELPPEHMARRSIDMINKACADLSNKPNADQKPSEALAPTATRTAPKVAETGKGNGGGVIQKSDRDGGSKRVSFAVPLFATVAALAFFSYQQYQGDVELGAGAQTTNADALNNAPIPLPTKKPSELLGDNELENLKQRLNENSNVTVVEPKPVTPEKPVDAALANQVDKIVGQVANAPNSVKVNSVIQVPSPQIAEQSVVIVPPPSGELETLTDNVVDALERMKQAEQSDSTSIPTSDDLRQSIATLVDAAQGQNRSIGDVETLLAEALKNRDAVPQLLANASGGLDIRQLVAGVVTEEARMHASEDQVDYLSALAEEGNSTNVVRKARPPAAFKSDARVIETEKGFAVRVIAGDSLSKLAFELYGDPLSYDRIYKLNRKVIRNVNVLRIGTVLAVPAPR